MKIHFKACAVLRARVLCSKLCASQIALEIASRRGRTIQRRCSLQPTCDAGLRVARRTRFLAAQTPTETTPYFRSASLASRIGRNSESFDQLGHLSEFAKSLPTL